MQLILGKAYLECQYLSFTQSDCMPDLRDQLGFLVTKILGDNSHFYFPRIKDKNSLSPPFSRLPKPTKWKYRRDTAHVRQETWIWILSTLFSKQGIDSALEWKRYRTIKSTIFSEACAFRGLNASEANLKGKDLKKLELRWSNMRDTNHSLIEEDVLEALWPSVKAEILSIIG
jgi:hypothetical protein